MKNSKFTPKQKKEYFAKLRTDWQKSKELAELDEWKAIIRECNAQGITASDNGIIFTAIQMKEHGYDGLPHIDCKTFKYWNEAGFKVKKGEKSKVKGITWISSTKEKNGSKKEDFVFPKVYSLFHKTQVQAI